MKPAPRTAGVTANARPIPAVPDNQVGAAAAAKAKAQAEMDAMGDQTEQTARRRRSAAGAIARRGLNCTRSTEDGNGL